MEEELQRSVMVSEGADIQLGDPASDQTDPRASEGASDATMASFTGNSVLVASGRRDGGHIVDSVESEHEEDVAGDDEDGDQEDGHDQEDDDLDDDEDGGDDEEEADSGGEDSEMSDEDNEADEDAGHPSESPSARRDGASAKEDVEEEDDDEGVGAVKIRPGETDDDDSEDSNLSDGQSESSEESDGEAAWEEAVEQNEEEEDEDDEDEDDNIQLGSCMFCKDGDERGSYLKCRGCGENCRSNPSISILSRLFQSLTKSHPKSTRGMCKEQLGPWRHNQ